jgi:hypothetical protein
LVGNRPKIKLLVNGGDAEELGLDWREMFDIRAVDSNRSRVREYGAGYDLDQSGFACAILAQENVDFAAFKREIHVI